ncbi:MAG TPA: Crp/Fnr family transcriptional regulator [Caulobacteraceae bacterium]|nr:Crp/Fnr family transcriptional regulator [Caulobacteraceae bacterium]
MGWENHFLDSLPTADLNALRPSLERISVERDRVLAEIGRPVAFVYLPRTCIVSVVAVMEDGRTVESRTIGHEGGVGLLHALGSRHAYERVTVDVPGESYRLPIDVLAAQAQKSNLLVRRIVSHAQATILQSAQLTACNTLHSVETRLCRWLLMTQDRLGGPEVVPLTQEHLAIMLGVQRTTVTAIAGELQAKGLIRYARGAIHILDRERIERCACECYEMMRTAAAQMLSEGAE